MVMVMNDLLPHPLCNVNRPSHSEIQLFQNLTIKIHGLGHVCGQRSRSHLTFNIQMSRSCQDQTHWWRLHLRPGVQSICLLFVSWQLDHFWLRYSKFHIWPWKFLHQNCCILIGSFMVYICMYFLLSERLCVCVCILLCWRLDFVCLYL